MYYQRPLLVRILESYFRHWRVFTIALISIIALIAAFVVSQPKTYSTTYTCVLNSDTLPNPLSNESGSLNWNAVQSSVNHFATLIDTKDFDEQALNNPASPVLLSHPIDFNDEEEVSKFQKSLSVTVSSDDAFTVNIVWSNPDDSLKIIQAMIQTFIEQNAQEKSSYWSEEVAFIGQEVDDYKNKLTSAEAELAAFKAANVSHLPSQQEEIEGQLVNLQQRIQDLNLQLSEDQDKQSLLANEIAQTPPKIIADETQVKSQLETLLENLQAKLVNDETVLGMKANHPTVIALKAQIDALSGQIAEKTKANSPETTNVSSTEIQPNPQYQFFQNQFAQNQIDQKELTGQISNTQNLILATQAGVAKVPEEQRILANLMRDYEFNNENYSVLKRRLTEAVINEQLNLRQQRGLYNLYLTGSPQSSTSKNKIAVLFLGGMVLAFLVAGALVVASEALDRSLRDPFDVQTALGVPVLAVLPESPELHGEDMRTPRLPGGKSPTLARGRLLNLIAAPISSASSAPSAATASPTTQGKFANSSFGADATAGAGEAG